MHHHLGHHCGTFHNGTVRCQIAFQHGKPSRFTVRIVKRPDYLGILIYRILNIFTDGLSRYRHAFFL